MTWLLFLYAFTLGVENNNLFTVDRSSQWYGYSEFEASVLVGGVLELGGGAVIYFQPDGLPSFSPVECDFPIFARLYFGILTIEAQHLCLHQPMQAADILRDQRGYTRLTLTLSNRRDK